jgi:uncharacterized membrane protein
MTEPQPRWTDQYIETIIGNLLRAGVLASALVVLAGAGIFLAHHARDPVKDRKTFEPEEDQAYTHPVFIVRAALAGRGRALIQFGLLLLIATPVARVFFSAFAFARQRDAAYVLITLIVLAILLYSLFSGKIH